MPSRAKAGETPTEKTARPSRAKKENAEVTDADAPVHQEPTDERKAGKETVKKYPLTERVKKFIEEIAPEAYAVIHATDEQIIEDGEKNKNNVVFITFSDDPSQEETPADFNKEVIKDVLLAWHIIPEKRTSGKTLFFEVLPETDDSPLILTCQEVGNDK